MVDSAPETSTGSYKDDFAVCQSETRTALYSIFARALSHPEGKILEAFVAGNFESDVMGLMDLIGYETPRLLAAGERAVQKEHDIKIAYASAFEAGVPKVSLREVNYTRSGEKILFEDLFRFYDHFGLDTGSGALREWPDHIAVELEFMHYLCWLEGGGDQENGRNREPLRLAQRDFLARHPGHWAGELAERLKGKNIEGPWARVAWLLTDFVAAEMSHLAGDRFNDRGKS